MFWKKKRCDCNYNKIVRCVVYKDRFQDYYTDIHYVCGRCKRTWTEIVEGKFKVQDFRSGRGSKKKLEKIKRYIETRRKAYQELNSGDDSWGKQFLIETLNGVEDIMT